MTVFELVKAKEQLRCSICLEKVIDHSVVASLKCLREYKEVKQ